MSTLRKSVTSIALRTYTCPECDSSTKAYEVPQKCHYCHKVGVMTVLLPATGSVEWLKDQKGTSTIGSRAWMADQMTAHFEELQTVRAAGQKEYAHTEEDAFANFRRLGKSLDLSKEKVLLVYAQKHMDGIYSYINGHVSQREPVQGRIKDLITYLHLLWGMLDAEA